MSPMCETSVVGVQAMGGGPLEPVWVESPLKFQYDVHSDTDKMLCYPTHCGVSDKEIYILNGALKPDSRTVMEEYLGMEFAGYNDRQERVMGIVPYHVST